MFTRHTVNPKAIARPNASYVKTFVTHDGDTVITGYPATVRMMPGLAHPGSSVTVQTEADVESVTVKTRVVTALTSTDSVCAVRMAEGGREGERS